MNLYESKKRKLFKTLNKLILLDSLNYTTEEITAFKASVKDLFTVYTFEEILKAGEIKLAWANVDRESIYAFSYTSGTTGTPKGAMISHINVCSMVDHI